jgi:hypothetical protein
MASAMKPRRQSYLLRAGEAWVIIPPRIAKLIEARTTINALRVQMRGIDPEATAVLEDLHAAAVSWRGFPETETVIDSQRKAAADSTWYKVFGWLHWLLVVALLALINHAQTVRNLKRSFRNAAAGARPIQAEVSDSKSAAELAALLDEALEELHRLQRSLERRIRRAPAQQ